jgi:putative membrane protein
MWKLFVQIVGGILGIYLAQRFVPNVIFTGTWQTLILIGVILGLLNYFIKPILKILTLPLRIITLGLFGLIINMIMVVAADILFKELKITGIIPIFWTSIIVWGISFFLTKWMPDKK